MTLACFRNWLRDMDDGPSVRPGANDGARYGLTWCGSFTVHGLGFRAMNGTTTDFAMSLAHRQRARQVLQDAYDIYDPVAGQDGYIETDDLNDIMRENGFRSLNSFTAAEGEGGARVLRAPSPQVVVQGGDIRSPDLYRWAIFAIQSSSPKAAAFDPYSDRALVATAIERGDGAPENAYNMAAYANARVLNSMQLRSIAVVPEKSVGHGMGVAAEGLRRQQGPRVNGYGPKFGH